MLRKLLIDEMSGYTRAAIIEDGRLCEIHAEKQNMSAQAENLYFGRVVSIRPSIRAAFVDIGDELNAFLSLGEDFKIRCGDMIIVQGLAKQATETKGLRITDRVNLAGKWLVLIPDSKGVHVSKKVKDALVRKELIEAGLRICPPDCGLIIRTSSESVTERLLEDEAQFLYNQWLLIKRKALGMSRPGLLWQREPLWKRLVRDLCDTSLMVTNSKMIYENLRTLQSNHRIPKETSIEWFEESGQLLFDAYGIESQIEKALHRRIWLPCGGYLVFDSCEAMTVIDVNSGKMMLGRSIEETALKVNLEAADEIARQLRVRDIGGMIVVDFIDMMQEAHREMVLSRIRESVRRDRTQVVAEGFTRLGLMELTRKRVHDSLEKSMKNSCSYCSATGTVLSGEEVALRILRQLRRMQMGGQRGPFAVRCSSAAAKALRGYAIRTEDSEVYICEVPGKHIERFEIEQLGAGISAPKDAVLMHRV